MRNPRRPSDEISAVSTETIVDRITTAVLEQRLPFGAKLGEEKLCAVFGVSRTMVRQALNRLARSKLVVLKPRRGAFLAAPTPDEARQIFEARRVIESEIFAQFTRAASDADFDVLARHVRSEQRAIRQGDVPLRNRLLGMFHVRIAEMVGNKVLSDIVADLVTRSSLITLLLQSAEGAACSSNDHVDLIAAMRARKVPLVRKLLREHLEHVERDLCDMSHSDRDFDLGEALRPSAVPARKGAVRRVGNGAAKARARAPAASRATSRGRASSQP